MLRLAWNAASFGLAAIRDLPRRAADALGQTGPGRPSMPGRLWKAMAVVCAIALFVWWALPQLIWVRSPSIDALAVRTSPGIIARHDLVMFKLHHPLAGPMPVNVTKYALCLPGDRLASFTLRSERFPGRIEAAFFCNGTLLGVSKAYGRNGQRLDYFRWKSGPIPMGRAYIGSSYKDGFDSRYFGLVPIAKLVRIERVL
jgi:hypothetical protein